MGSADHHSVLVADGEDEGKYVGREDGTNDIDGSFDEDGSLDGKFEGFDDGEDEGKYFGREDSTNDDDGSLEIEGFDDGVDVHDEVKGSQMGLE